MSAAIIALMVICCCSSSGTGAMFGLGYIPQTEPHYMRVTGMKELMELSDKIKKSGKQDDCPKFGEKFAKIFKKNKKYKEDFGGFYTHDLGFISMEDEDMDNENVKEYWEDRGFNKLMIKEDGTAMCENLGA